MPLFYLHVYNQIGLARDEEGEDLPDIDLARKKAIDGIRSILSDEAHQGVLDLRGKVEIANDRGEVLDVVPFSDAFELHFTSESA